MNKEISEALNALMKSMQKTFEEKQNDPHQYVVAYMRQDNDELIGYHYDSFCTVGKDILEAKRYSGEDPYPQLKTISQNLKSILDNPNNPEDIFYSLVKRNRGLFNNMKSSEVYMDAIYLCEGTPKQSFHYKILDNEQNTNGE